MLDACLSPDTTVTISSRAAEDLVGLDLEPWHTEGLYLRGDGSELPFARNPFQMIPPPGGAPIPTTLGAGTWELLFQRARGQFLQIRVELSGNGQRTPRLRALRIYYPRFSYLDHYLPAAYRQESTSADFLERFLANPEGFYTAAEDKIINVRQLFDVSSAPVDALDWLAGWFGALLDPSWDDYRRRLFIRNAMLFFQYRGTLRGLRMALRLALEPCVTPDLFSEPCCSDFPAKGQRLSALRIVESFRARRFPGVLLGDPTDVQQKGIIQANELWKPDQGRAILNALYEKASGFSTGYPIQQPPGDPTEWQNFSLATLGFVPAATTADWNLWQAFLMRAYGTVTNYNAAYSLDDKNGLESFDDAVMPSELPPDGLPLEDWYQFETVFLPLAHNAHHFVILLPMMAGLTKDSQAYQDRLTLAKKVVELEKPAHTTYDIRLFWALFRIGEARLGLDTQLDYGSRNPNFPAPFVIGQESLAESYLTSGNPPLPADRFNLGANCLPGSGAQPPPQAQRPQIRYAKTASRCAG
jgi:phage tail-like protein